MTRKHEHQLFVRKEDGSTELFDQFKLKESLIKSGAKEEQAEKILHSVVEAFIDEGRKIDKSGEQGAEDTYCTASEIYERAFSILKEASRVVAARYSLRRSLLEFGPTGFPFEEYIAQLFKAKWGFESITDQVVFGSCVPHEVDVVSWTEPTKNHPNGKLIMAEVKYHHDPASKTDLKVALYVKARYDDLKDNVFEYGDKKRKMDEGWLVTNTRFTDTAITYGTCKGLKLLSWDYPDTDNLQDMIETTMLHPVTCLVTLSGSEKRALLERDIVLAKSLFEKVKDMELIGFSKEKIETVLDEVSEIINTVPGN